MCDGRRRRCARSSKKSRPEVASDGAIPRPPKKTIDEHRQTQAAFLRDELEPVLTQARTGQRSVFFVDAAHFVQGSFLCCV